MPLATLCRSCEKPERKVLARSLCAYCYNWHHTRGSLEQFGRERWKRGMVRHSKRCAMCETEKPAADFHKVSTKADGLSTYCKRCDQIRARARFYKITQEQYLLMLLEQDGRCAICRDPGLSADDLVVDHCHESGAVRGLLCQACNQGLGRFRDDAARLIAAAHYVTSRKDI